MAYILRNMHFLVIHVPIAMLLFSFVFDVLAIVVKKKEWHAAGLLCLTVGTLGAIAAVITGPEGERNPLLPTHELFGKLTMILFIIVTLVRLWFVWKKRLELGRNPIYLIVALIGVLLVSYTGHLGGKMVHPDRPERGDFRDGGNFRGGGNFRQQPNGSDEQQGRGGQRQQQQPQQSQQPKSSS